MSSNISYKETTKQKCKSDKHKAEFKGKELGFYIIRVSHVIMGYVESLVLVCASILRLQRRSLALLVLGLLLAGLVQLPYLRPSWTGYSGPSLALEFPILRALRRYAHCSVLVQPLARLVPPPQLNVFAR